MNPARRWFGILVFAAYSTGVFLTLAGLAKMFPGTEWVAKWINFPGVILTHAFLGYLAPFAIKVTLREVAATASVVVLVSMILGWAWGTRRRYWNMAHGLFGCLVVLIFSFAAIPHQPISPIGDGPNNKLLLMGDGSLLAGWEQEVRKDGRSPDWVHSVEPGFRPYSSKAWWAKLPGVEYYFLVSEKSGWFGSNKKRFLEHRLTLKLWWLLVPAALYPILMTAAWIHRRLAAFSPPRVTRLCPECTYNLTHVTGPSCPGCGQPVAGENKS